MNKNEILGMVDHTLLSKEATWQEIRTVCDDALKYGTASVCVPASYVSRCAEYLQGRVAVCTVIGFPNGYSTTAVKCFEAEDAIANGADEIDMVINIGMLKDGDYAGVLEEIRRVKAACGEHILKVIIETCLLSEAEKLEMCRIVSLSGADYIKTSTGFSSAGATPEDVALFAANISDDLKIKAAGGIKSFEDAERFISLGASRLGTSRLVAIMKKDGTKSEY